MSISSTENLQSWTESHVQLWKMKPRSSLANPQKSFEPHFGSSTKHKIILKFKILMKVLTWALKVVVDFEKFLIFLHELTTPRMVLPIDRPVLVATAQQTRRYVENLVNKVNGFDANSDFARSTHFELRLDFVERPAELHLSPCVHEKTCAVVWREVCGAKRLFRAFAQFFHWV